MKLKNAILVTITVFICLFIISIPTASSSALNADPKPSSQGQQLVEDQIKQAILESVATNERYAKSVSVVKLQVTDVKITPDKQWATAWIVYYDPQIEAIIPTEPGLAVTHFVNDKWQVYLPSQSDWQNAIDTAPTDLITQQEKDMWVAMKQSEVESVTTQSGYLLPWHGGLTGYLSRSVGHDADFTTAHYAFDFYFPGTTSCLNGPQDSIQGTNGYNFTIYAARAGTVWGWKDSVADCDHSDVNFIVLRNADDPTIFQLYMHLSHNSIPPELKSVGAPVARGQFIGVADNTGNSTGTHLHFQIEHQPYWPSANPYWATALDMSFDDVDINGGRPRVSPLDPPYCDPGDICNVFRSTYLSNNYYMGDSTPPVGGLSGVSAGQVVQAPTITLSGWGYDAQTGLDYGQLKGFFDGNWHDLGSQFNPNFTYNWDVCNYDLPVPNGPVSVALFLYDIAGNPAPLVGLTNFSKDYSCPVPPTTCIPGQNEVTLFEDSYYQGGCVKFPVGSYPTGNTLNPVGNNDADSILVGSNVVATFYSEENYTGHSQAFDQNMGYMQYDWVYSNSLSSMKVSPKTSQPSAPVLVSPINNPAFRQGDVIPFSWINGGGAVDYTVEIYLNSNLYRVVPWQQNPVVYVDSLGQGAYSWRVQGRNSAGVGSWSQANTFSIQSPLVIPTEVTVPYSDTMETTEAKWVRDGLWTYIDNGDKAHSGTHSWWYQNTAGNYDTGLPNSGSLTSQPISITSPGYYLRFYYRYQTETQGKSWDERWVQISVDGGPYTNLVQLSDDVQMPESSSWLRNKAIDLSAYSGHIIRIRFMFTTFDATANNYPGWGIDDLSITATAPPFCSENRQDDTPAQAFLLTYDPSINIPGKICPNGDYDYYKFYGEAGDRIVADVNANSIGSPLDSYLYLLDTDGQTVLAENDDEVYAQRRDPLIGYTLPGNGIYYLKLKAWKHPLTGGDNYSYTIRLYEDHAKPVASISWPSSYTYLPDTDMTVTANVSDVSNGVNRVEFYWHSLNWLSGVWEYLGTDWDGANGWSMTFSPAGEPEGSGAAFFVEAYDMAGNWSGAASWNIGIDKTAPTTALNPLTASQSSNAFLLGWTASDNLSGLAYYEIQEKMNGGSWSTYPPIDGSKNNYWIVGSPGNTYSYQMRGIDNSGNTELYPGNAETTTSIPAASIICYAPDSYDTSGNDNSPATASMIYVDGASQVHNYCNPLIPGYINDEDWVKLIAENGHNYMILSLANSPQAASLISLYAQDGTTLLKESAPVEFGKNTSLTWSADRDGPVYIRFRHVDGRVIGTGVGTTIMVKTAILTFFPQIFR